MGPVLLASMILSSCCLAAPAGDKEDVQAYTVEAVVLSCPGETVEIVSDSAAKTGSAFALIGEASLKLGDVTLAVSGGRLTWNGKPAPPKASGIVVQATPKLTVLANQNAVLLARSLPPQYFERQEDGSFRLHSLPKDQAPGLTCGVTIAPHGEKVEIDLEVRFVRVMSRQEIPGVELPVGKPEIATQGVMTKLGLDLGQWGVVAGREKSEGIGALLVLLKVTRAGSGAFPGMAASDTAKVGKKALERTFTLSVEDIPADQVLLRISTATGVTIKMTDMPKDTPTITVELQEVPVLEAVRFVTELTGYTYKIVDDHIEVSGKRKKKE